MAALMTSDADNIDRLTIEISDCKKSGIKVMNPDVNESFADFAIVKNQNTIRFGLGAIKNVGHGAAEKIIEERDANGTFKDLEDFFVRVSSSAVNKKVVESLIRTGGLDSFGYTRQSLLNQLDTLIAFSQKRDKEALSNQSNLFGDSTNSQTKLNLIKSEEEAPEHEKLSWERELLGLYLSAHPLDKYEEYLKHNAEDISELKPEEVDGASGIVGGTITASREITTKKGDKMAFMTVADLAGEIELIIFPQAYLKFATILNKPNAVIIAKGKFDAKDRDGNLSDDLKMMVNEVELVTEEDLKNFDPTKPPKKEPKSNKETKQVVHDGPGSKLKLKKNAKVQLESEKEQVIQKLYIKIADSKYENNLIKLKSLVDENQGVTSIILVFGEKPDQRALQLPFKLNITPSTRTELGSIFDKESLSFQ